MSNRVSVNRPLHFSKKQLEECTNTTFEKLIIHLPKCKRDVYLNTRKDDWGVYYISYGTLDKMTELINLILEWKYKAEQYDKEIEK